MPSTLDDYEVLYSIGSGSYGTCKKIKRKKDGKVLVWKQLDYGCMSEAEKQLLVSEVNLLRELKHQNIVRYYDRIIDRVRTSLYIIMEYCQGGDLSSVIQRAKKEKQRLEAAFVWKIFAQVVSALKICHRRTGGQAVLHRDLKPANVFLDANKNVKLGDFGLARVLHHETSFAKTFVGTPYYMSPEQMNYSQYNEKSDIWSLGCLIYELCALHPPFTANNQKDLAIKIRAGKFARIPAIYPDELQEVIVRMLQVEEDRRPSIEILAKHPQVLLLSSPEKPHSKLSGSGDSVDEKSTKLKEWEDRLARKEEDIKRKERQLLTKEQDIESRLKQLELREKTFEEKVKKREQRILSKDVTSKYTQPKRSPTIPPTSTGSPFYEILPPSCMTKARKDEMSPKKKVHFDENGKLCRQAYSNYKHSELKARLQRAKSRALELRSVEKEATTKSHHILGMR